jgi:hypothetical protein
MKYLDYFRHWRRKPGARTLGDASDHLSEICARFDYTLDLEDRRDRRISTDDETPPGRRRGGAAA